MHQYFLLQNASICTISTHFASIFLLHNASTLPTHFVTKKNQNVTIVTLLQNALYQWSISLKFVWGGREGGFVLRSVISDV